MSRLGTAHVVQGDARSLPVRTDSVDLIVTSPPYFALRSYQDAGEHYAGQIGNEPTLSEFVESLLDVTRECIRVLKPTGSLWVNLGDKYSTYAGNRSSGRSTLQGATDRSRPVVARKAGLDGGGEVRAKSLMGIPWRYALRCIDDLGLILRAEVVWSKPNGMPESVTDRVRRSHEQWFHFTLQPRYYSAVDRIREPHAGGQTGLAATFGRPKPSHDLVPGQTATQHRADRPETPADHPLGKLPGSVWVIPTEPLNLPRHVEHARCCHGTPRPGCEDGVDHFAAFPSEWPKRIIQGWSPAAVCTVCGEGRRPSVLAQRMVDGVAADLGARKVGGYQTEPAGIGNWRFSTERAIVGETCGCPDVSAPSTPGVVLDPFGGTGTTAMVAKALGRTGITVDKSFDYCSIAQWRTNDRDQLAKVLGVAKAPTVHSDEQSLMDLLEER